MKYRVYAIILGALFFIIGVITLPHYGINWDEPTHFLRGQAYLHFFLTGRKDYNDLLKFTKYYQESDNLFYKTTKKQEVRRSIYQFEGYTATDWLSGIFDDVAHPPLNGILAAFFNYIFFQKLGIINDIDSHHLFIVFVASILVGAIFLWVRNNYGFFAGLISALSLSLYPLFLAESHFNIKDIPEAVFYSLTLLSFYNSVVDRSIKWMLISSVFFGLALSTKFNIVFAPFIVFMWILFYLITIKFKFKSFIRLIPAVFLYFPLAFSIFVISWPVMWSSPFSNFIKAATYYKGMGTGAFDSKYLTFFGFNTFPFQWILYTTPLVILFFAFFGIIYTLSRGIREKNKTSFFILIWLILPILRVSIPGSMLYGGVRHIMEYIPAMAILSGIGASYIVKLLNCYIVKVKKQFSNTAIKSGEARSRFARQLSDKRIKFTLQLLVILSFLPITLKLISIHPNEGVYFNPIIGGLKGAKEKDIPYWGESLGNPFRQGLTWVNKNAQKNAKLTITYGMGSNLPGILIRPDIDFHNTYRGYTYKGGEYIIGLTNKNIYEESYYLKYVEKFLIPVYEEKIDGVSIMKVWKNDQNHTRSKYKKENKFEKNIKFNLANDQILLDLGQNLKLRRLNLSYQAEKCNKNEEEIFVQTSTNNVNWKDVHDRISRFILNPGKFENSMEYNYYFTGETARYIKINYLMKEACLDKTYDFKIYTLN